ncbi:DUF2442 domain-containing protein [Thiomicrospira microaerophila]|uniref:DUF2442 domain-containing protein n=1 Tax=Thiomicrospira microaerophila TaxID=406020 RepID=UPI0005CA3712|nr:DUF2442 domain-containing protein [Thiomicrospira microaerophila]
MIKILTCDYQATGLIYLAFSDGTDGVFNLSDYIKSRTGDLLEKLKDDSFASRCFIDAGALCWPHGLELSPSRLYELVHQKQAA